MFKRMAFLSEIKKKLPTSFMDGPYLLINFRRIRKSVGITIVDTKVMLILVQERHLASLTVRIPMEPDVLEKLL